MTQGFDITLLVGYNKSNENDIPVLVIGQKVGRGIDILNVITGAEASELFGKLLEKGKDFQESKQDGLNPGSVLMDEMDGT